MSIVLSFGLSQQLGCNECVNGLPQFCFVIKVEQIAHELVGVLLQVLVGQLLLPDLADPLVLKSLFCCRPLAGVIRKQVCDEVFSLFRHVLPDGVLKVVAADLDLLHDLLVTRVVKRRPARKKDIGYHSARPNIALVIVVLLDYLWSDIVRSSYLKAVILRLAVIDR